VLVLLAVACSASDPPAKSEGSAGAAASGRGGSGGAASTGGAGGGAAGDDSGGGAAAAAGAGAGGVAGSGGGSTGSGGGSAGSSSALGPCDAPGIFLCDDFEAAAAGSFPALEGWLDNPCTSHVVDASMGYQSTQSLKAQYQYNDCMVHADVTAHEDIYLRSWIKLGAPSTMSGHHIGLLELGSKIADDPELRIGIRDGGDACAGKPGIDVTVGGLPIGERTSCSAVSMAEDAWYCLEAHVERDLPNILRFTLWLDGAEIVAETSYEPVNADWVSEVFYFKFGRSSYGGDVTFPVWHDDVALGTQRIGCGQ
jgi:hypothetical protein